MPCSATENTDNTDNLAAPRFFPEGLRITIIGREWAKSGFRV
jgi:hypothetical protein